MFRKSITSFLLLASLLSFSSSALAQSEGRLTREQILSMTTEELSELPLEDLMAAVETLGVSSVDELFYLIMNKSVSSASKTEENSFTSPLSSTVITRDEMRTYGVTSIEEALRLIPGMIVSEKTNGVYDVHMRGLTNIPDNNMLIYTEEANILVMVDGRITHNYALGAPFLDLLPIGIEDVERIEVVRGATGALYGPNAVNGVINIITERPDQAQKKVSGSLQVGNDIMLGDFALRTTIGSKLALGLTGNFQSRQRKDDLLPLLTQSDVYVVNDANTLLSEKHYISKADFEAALASGQILDVSGGQRITVEQSTKLYTMSGYDEETGLYKLQYTCVDDDNIYDKFEEPQLSRRNMGFNGYLTFTPADRIRFDLNGGWQKAYYATTPLGNEDVAIRYRRNKSGYLALNAQIANLHLLANYSTGPLEIQQGTFGFDQKYTHMVNAQAEYDINVKELNIRPGVSYQWVRFESPEAKYYDYGYGIEERAGYWGFYSKGYKGAELNDLSLNVRLDWKHDNLRVIGAYRTDKTNIPDKWNHSWQLALSYLFNDNNFLRLSYGRSFRSASLANTSSNYCWRRAEGQTPAKMQFLGNEDAELMHIDNIEIGYRFRPTNSLLIDAEAFYGRSTDYGEIKSYSSMVTLSGSALEQGVNKTLENLSNGVEQSEALAFLQGTIQSGMSTKSNMRYDNLPFVVHQLGLGVNIDWIASSKLIMKLNANIQRTTIDNYYQYQQVEMITKQLIASQTAVLNPNYGMNSVITELLTGALTTAAAGGDVQEYVGECTAWVPYSKYAPEYLALDNAGKKAYLKNLKDMYARGETVDGEWSPMALYYSLKYNVQYDSMNEEYYMGTSVAEEAETEDNYKHEATPAFYGMLGAIYKPTAKWDISAFANFMTKRSYTTLYGVTELDPRFTVNLKVGYRPIENCEIFFGAHNLFNTQKQEFIFTDKIGGTYTFGVNFGI